MSEWDRLESASKWAGSVQAGGNAGGLQVGSLEEQKRVGGGDELHAW